MYIEMVDETGQVSQEIIKQTQEILEFAAQKTGKENKEMAVTFVTNERSHELNLEYRDTDRPTDVISLEYKRDCTRTVTWGVLRPPTPGEPESSRASEVPPGSPASDRDRMMVS